MDKKGFTLVELLAVIIIIALLITITATSVLGVMKDVKTDIREKKYNSFKDAADTYIKNVLDEQDVLYTETASGVGRRLTGYDLLEYVGTCDTTNNDYCEYTDLEDGKREYMRKVYFDSAAIHDYIDFENYNITAELFTDEDGTKRYVTKTGGKNLCKLKANIYVTTVNKGNRIYYELSNIVVETRDGLTSTFCVK